MLDRSGTGTVRNFAYESLVDRAQTCRLCSRMEGRRRVLGRDNGPLDARMLFVAEAPGRLGGDVTGVPLLGDQSGRNFAQLLHSVGWRRQDVFVTNAVLCNPRDTVGRNRKPSALEIGNCSLHLRDTLDILDPPYVVALGRTALDALARIAPHSAILRRDAGRGLPWHGRTLVPLYHPGPKARLHRSLEQQTDDFARLRFLVENGPAEKSRY